MKTLKSWRFDGLCALICITIILVSADVWAYKYHRYQSELPHLGDHAQFSTFWVRGNSQSWESVIGEITSIEDEYFTIRVHSIDGYSYHKVLQSRVMWWRSE